MTWSEVWLLNELFNARDEARALQRKVRKDKESPRG